MFGNRFFKIAVILIIALACLSVIGCKKQKPAAEPAPGYTETTSQPSEQPQAEPKMPAEPNTSGMPAEPNTPNEPNMSATSAGVSEPCEPNVPIEPNQPSPEQPM